MCARPLPSSVWVCLTTFWTRRNDVAEGIRLILIYWSLRGHDLLLSSPEWLWRYTGGVMHWRFVCGLCCALFSTRHFIAKDLKKKHLHKELYYKRTFFFSRTLKNANNITKHTFIIFYNGRYYILMYKSTFIIRLANGLFYLPSSIFHQFCVGILLLEFSILITHRTHCDLKQF